MKRQWHIQTRILVTLIAMITVILLAVVVVFNVAIQGYIHRRISAQMDGMLMTLANPPDRPEEDRHDRRENTPEALPEGAERPDPDFTASDDKITGTEGGALILDESGNLRREMGAPERAVSAIVSYAQATGMEHIPLDKSFSIRGADGSRYALSIIRDPIMEDSYLVFYVDTTSLTAYTTQVNLLLCVIILAAIVLSVILSRHLARSFAKPVERLSRFAGEIGGGNLRRQELQFRDAEFNHLAEAMNRMAEELSAANEKQETFFQNVSHELRTPLTSIRGNAEGILFGVMDPQDSSRIILTETDRLSGFVEDLLYMSRMGRGPSGEEYPPLDLRELLSLCVSEQHAEASRRNVTFQFDFDEDPVTLPIREQDAHQLFSNLISNAIRYAERQVTLSCHGGGEIAVSVSDDGPGVAPEDREKIFERFYKGQGGKHGIGLSIVKAVVDGYGGEIAVAGGQGACFTVRFPARPE